jgi:hypothetical protein
MKIIALLLTLFSVAALAQTSQFNGYTGGPCGVPTKCGPFSISGPLTITGNFTLLGIFNATTNRPPASWYPYPQKSLWKQPIPADCRGTTSGPPGCDIVPGNYSLSATSSQTMAKAALGFYLSENLGQPGGSGVPFSMIIASDATGGSGPQVAESDQGFPIYYCGPGSGCPYYLVSHTNGCGYDPFVNIAVQIPNKAAWTGGNTINNSGGGDGWLTWYDQVQGLRGGMGRFSSGHTTYTLPNCTASTPQTACVLTGDVLGSACGSERPGFDLDWGWVGSSAAYSWTSPSGFVDTLGGELDNIDQSAIGGMEVVRLEEFAVDINNNIGQILHQTQSSIGCVNGIVFPATSSAFACSGLGFTNYQQWGPNGGLVYCDYTAAQIASFQLPAWQNIIVTAICTYGTYPAVTSGAQDGAHIMNGDNQESELPYFLATGNHHPAYAWIAGQKLGSPLCNGTNCPAQVNISSACGGGGNAFPESYYKFNCNVLYGIPPLPGESNSVTEQYVYQHFHYIDPCVLKGMENNVGGSQSNPCYP